MKKIKINLTAQQKHVLKTALTVLQIMIIVFTAAISVVTIISTNKSEGELASSPLFKVSFLPVLTDSMEPAVSEGDLLVVKTPEDKEALKIGQIITFSTVINGKKAINTHRIIEVTANELQDEVIYITKGDNAPDGKTETVYSKDVLAVYSNKIAGLGSVVLWLQNPANFFLTIMIPLILLFLLNGYYFARMIINIKLKKALEGKEAAKLSEEEIRKKAVEEYIASQQSPAK